MQNHVYTIGSSMIFVKKTDTITELNRKMRLQSADTALEEAIRGSEKSDIQYCQDLFDAILAALGNEKWEELVERGRDCLAKRAFRRREDYDKFEFEVTQTGQKQSLQLCNILSGDVGLAMFAHTAAFSQLLMPLPLQLCEL